MKNELPTVELVSILLLFAAPRKKGSKPELWAWERLEEILPDVLHHPDVLPEVKELLLRKFLLPVIRKEIERPSSRGPGAPRKDARDDLIVRCVNLLTAGGMRKKEAFRKVGELVNNPPLRRDRVERIYYEQKRMRKSLTRS